MLNADKETINLIRSYGENDVVPYKTMFKVITNDGTKWVVAHRVPTLHKLHPTYVCMETCDGLIFTTSVFNLHSNTKEWPAQEQKQRKTYKRPSKMQWLPWNEKYLKEGALVKCRDGIVHKLSKEETYSKEAQLLPLWFSSFNHKTGANRWVGGYDIVSVLVDNRELGEEQRTESSYKLISLLLTQDEAQVLRNILGHCVIGDSEKSRRKFADSVFDKLKSHTKRNSLSETGISPDGYSISFEDET